MLARVRELIIQKPWKNVELEESDMRDLETLKDNSFTHAITNFGIALMGEDAEGPLKVQGTASCPEARRHLYCHDMGRLVELSLGHKL